MPVPEKIVELVERFKQNEDLYKSSDYDEENTKVEFINPFFKELGWDVYNENNIAPQYKEVVFEDKVSINGKKKAPDYSFRIGPEIKFFVEAKKPSVEIETDKNPSLQIRRYGWSAGLKLCILTDFEEFAIYDTTIKPDRTHSPSIGRIRLYKYTDYIEKWDEISNIFSKESVWKGEFDKVVKDKSHVKKKGTATFDKEFLKEIENWRLILARNIAIRNESLSEEEINLAVQLIIDRIIFFRMAEDRGIEKYETLHKLLNKEDIYKEFVKLCFKADVKYNSGLFHFHEEKDSPDNVDTFTPNLNIDDGVFKQIFKNLYYPNSPYEFSVISPEILGKIYEQFLGSVIRLTPSHQAKIDVKPEVRKGGGVFYTPSQIVKKIVESTLGDKIKNKTKKELDKIKIIDISCGSGSFLLKAYQKLLDAYLDYYTNLKHPPKNVIYKNVNGITQLTITEKKRILKNSIYGVDIDMNAIEVSKLSLLLKVLEDQNSDDLEKQSKLYNERALPNLGDNIVCGNSLIETDILNYDYTINELKHFNPFDYRKHFKTIFEENGGFDIVIGNPPFVRQEQLKLCKPYLQEHFNVHTGGCDKYVYFFEKGLNILNDDGILSYICSSKYTKTGYGVKLRGLLLDYTITKYNDYSNNQDLFDGATTYPSIIEVKNKKPSKNHKIRVDDEYDIYQNRLTDSNWSFKHPKVLDLKNKIEDENKQLKEIKSLNITRGISTGCNDAFIINETVKDELISKNPNTDNLILPLIKGRDIKKYQINFNNHYLLYIPWRFKIRDFLEIKEYLDNFKDKLCDRAEVKDKKYSWYCLSRYGSNNSDYYKMPKLVYPRMIKSLTAVYDEEGYCLLDSAFMINHEDNDADYLKALSGIFSSNVLDFYMKLIVDTMRGETYSLKKIYVQTLPICELNDNDVQVLSEYVTELLKLNKELKECNIPKDKQFLNNRISVLEDEMNNKIYELYNLDKEEIKIILENI